MAKFEHSGIVRLVGGCSTLDISNYRYVKENLLGPEN